MCYLHSLDILHGDLTGGNILLISSNKDLRGFIAKVCCGAARIFRAPRQPASWTCLLAIGSSVQRSAQKCLQCWPGSLLVGLRMTDAV